LTQLTQARGAKMTQGSTRRRQWTQEQ